MTKHSLAPSDVVREWRDAPLEEAEDSDTEQRRAIVELMQQRLQETVVTGATQRRWRRIAVIIGVAAAASAAVAVGMHLRRAPSESVATMRSFEGSVSVTHAGPPPGTSRVTDDTTLIAGDKLVTAPDGRTSLQLESGVSIKLGAASRLHLPEPGAASGKEQVRLDRGVVDVRVPHLVAGQSFSVLTPDAVVTVHGTAFTVEVGEFVASDQPLRNPGGERDVTLTTRVRVSEGVVAVSSAGREVLVERGMQWMSPRAEPASPAVAQRDMLPRMTTDTPSALPSPATVPSIKPPSKLADQTRLLQAASEAARKGNQAGAIRNLNEVLRRYPESSLAPEARIQLFRALAASGDKSGAAREARRYLAAYPNGAAREEAQKLALPR